jgi:hypothetical protein
MVKLFLLLHRVGPARKEEGFKFPTEKRAPLAAPMGDAFQGDFDGTAVDVWVPRPDCWMGRADTAVDTPAPSLTVVNALEAPWSGEWTALNPSRFWNGFGDGRSDAFDAVEPVLESTWLVFLLDSHVDPNNAWDHPKVLGGVVGLLFLFLGVEDMVYRKIFTACCFGFIICTEAMKGNKETGPMNLCVVVYFLYFVVIGPRGLGRVFLKTSCTATFSAPDFLVTFSAPGSCDCMRDKERGK